MYRVGFAVSLALCLIVLAAPAAERASAKRDAAPKAAVSKPAASPRNRGTAKKQLARKPPIEEGFESLFDGKSLNGWQGATASYEVKNGVLASKDKAGGNLFTTRQYADFILRFEFKLTPGANNGIGIRAPLDGRVSRTGMEIQIIDDSAKKYQDLHDYQFHGSIYGLVPAKRGFLKPVGQWNQEEILCQGPHVQVTLNGQVIVDADLNKLEPIGLDGDPHPGRNRTKGYIALLGHKSRVEFRNLRIKELK